MASRRGAIWTNEEDQYVRDYIAEAQEAWGKGFKLSLNQIGREIAEKLGRSGEAVTTRIYQIIKEDHNANTSSKRSH